MAMILKLTKTRRAMALATFLAALSQTELATAGFVTVTASFGDYQGVIGNGLINNIYQAQSFIDGVQVAPSAPAPGLESLFTAPDQGIGLTTFNTGGVSSVEFHDSIYDPTNNVWNPGDSNIVQFDSAPAVETAVGQEILLGTFTFQNGNWWAANPIHTFGIELTTSSADPALNGHTFSDTLVLDITPNLTTVTPEQRADIYYFAGRPDLGSVRVFEASDGLNRGSIDLYGRIGSLIPTRFANPTGGVFLSDTTGPLPNSPVPEPSSIVLLVSGLIVAAGSRRVRTATLSRLSR